jgi:hypothetical protein
MSKKTKVGGIVLLICATLFLGMNGSLKETYSASRLLVSPDKVFFGDFINIFSDNQYYKFSDGVLYNNRISEYSELKEIASVIYEITPISRKLYGDMMQTKCVIKSIIKSGEIKHSIKDVIYVYEQYRVSRNNQLSTNNIHLGTPIYPMKDGERYLVFLNPVDAYTNKIHFNLVSTVFGIIPIKDTISIYTDPQTMFGIGGSPVSILRNSDYVLRSLNTSYFEEYSQEVTDEINQLMAQQDKMDKQTFADSVLEIKDKLKSYEYAAKYKETISKIIKDALKDNFLIDAKITYWN